MPDISSHRKRQALSRRFRPAKVRVLFIGESPPASGRCYLVDLCPEPVDQLNRSERRAACHASEGALALTIARLQPASIVTVVRSIEANVERVILTARWRGTFIRLPYPGRWSSHRTQFVGELIQHLA